MRATVEGKSSGSRGGEGRKEKVGREKRWMFTRRALEGEEGTLCTVGGRKRKTGKIGARPALLPPAI